MASLEQRIEKKAKASLERGLNREALMMAAAVGEDAVTELEVSQQAEQLKADFALFDKNKDGFLTADEIVGILTRVRTSALGDGGPVTSPVTKEDAEAFVKMHDTNGDGKLDYGEFAHAIVKEQDAELRKQIAFDQNVLVLVSKVRKELNGKNAPLPLGVSMEAMAHDALSTARGSVPEAMQLMAIWLQLSLVI